MTARLRRTGRAHAGFRAAPETGFSRSVTSSIVVHLVGVVALILAHQYVVTHPQAAPSVMTITLGGSTGPRSTGRTAASAKPVDEMAPQPKHEPIKTAASQSSVMTLPVRSEPKPQVNRDLPTTFMPKPPTIGAQVRQGSSLAETGSTSQDTGLTVGGGVGSSARLEVDANFCCMAYVQTMLQRIEAKWSKDIPGRGEATLRFVIQRSGKVTDITVEKSTGAIYENQSLSALQQAQIPPLPPEFKDDHLVIHLRFPYGIQ
jgi:TonB family protein